jgi:general secretion pathway protein D
LPTDSPLVYQFVDELVYITTRENQNLFNRPEQVLYDVTDLVTSFGDIAFGENDGLMTGESLSGVSEVGEGVTALSTSTLMELIQETIDPDSWNADGVSVTEYEVGKILISHSVEIHRQIQELLDLFRKQQKLQVSIEVRFITSEENDLFDMGVEWRGLPEVQMQNLVSAGAGVYSSRTNLSSDTRIATLMGSAADSTVDGAPPFITENRSSQGFNAQLSVLDPIRANIVMHALSRKRNIKSLLAPRLTVINNRQGYFINSIDETYVRNWEPDGGNYVPEVARVSSGELLVVRPTVSSDRRYISLDLSPQITRKLRFENRALEVPVIRNTTNEFGVSSTGVETLALTIELPVVEVWQVQTRVQVPDGGVVFVGGRMGNTEKRSSRSVPVISRIPFVGRLFKSDGDHIELENLIISVRAKILIFDELESKLY